MRLPSKPDALETSENTPASPVNPAVTVNRDPSYPDRKRIDSDVRAFLRPVSSPWIVFDRDSRIDPQMGIDDFAKSALRVGAVFSSSPGLTMPVDMPQVDMSLPMQIEQQSVVHDPIREGVVLSSPMSSVTDPSTNMFPVSSALVPPSPESISEPSNLVVASDVMQPADAHAPTYPAQDIAASIGDSSSNFSNPFINTGLFGSKKSRAMAIAGAAFGVLAMVGLIAVSRAEVAAKNAAATTQAMQMQPAAPQRDEIPAIAVAAPQAPQPTIEIDSAPAAAPAAPVAEPPPVVDPATKIPLDPKKRFGKLTIKADAKHKNVWFDGKRMLGNGQRTFNVFCGMHTVAVADKADTKDIEIPCNGEFVVSK